jgi:hypothetical protein
MSIWDSYKNIATAPLSWFGGGEDPAKAANKYLEQIPGVGEKYYNPYIEGGKEAGGLLKDQYGKMLDPTAFMDEILKHYNTSQGAQYQLGNLSKDIGNTAAAGGIAGTPEHQRQYGELAQDIMSKDMQQYLQNALGIQKTGLEGENNFYNKGFEASGSLADLISGTLGSQAGLAYQGANSKNASNAAFMNALMKALSTGAGAYFGGAGGATAGSNIGKNIFG